MKRFSFRLEKILGIRKAAKEEAKRYLFQCMRELKDYEMHLTVLEQEYEKSRLPEDAIISVENLQILGSYAFRVKEEIGKTREDITKAQTKVQQAMDRYIAASKEEKALVTLKDKRFEEYQESVAKEEQNSLDEVAVQRSVRGKEAR